MSSASRDQGIEGIGSSVALHDGRAAKSRREGSGPFAAHLTDPWAGRLSLAPCTVKAALRYVSAWHRHLPELQGGLFAASCVDEAGYVVAVGIAGNPSRVWQGKGRVVVSRVAASVPGNACGMLYGALTRGAQALGYRDAWTYTLPEESGKTLRGAGFVDMGLTDGGDWGRPSRARAAAVRSEPKRRWARALVKVSLREIAQAWAADTSYWPARWSAENPALGQCAATALFVQELRGGQIARGKVLGQSHYWNIIGGLIVDLTAAQFGGVDCGEAHRLGALFGRDELIANADTRRRYELLRARALQLDAIPDEARATEPAALPGIPYETGEV